MAYAHGSTELQSPSDHAGFRPGLGVEVGLPARFTAAVHPEAVT
jgi:hypothetical protein